MTKLNAINQRNNGKQLQYCGLGTFLGHFSVEIGGLNLVKELAKATKKYG